MMPIKVSPCGRFVVLDGLHLDRNVFEALARWASDHDLRVQDAIQFVLCIFRDRAMASYGLERSEGAANPAHGT
jgi:hypothetical protein